MGILTTLDKQLAYVRFLAEDGALVMAADKLEETAAELRKASDDRHRMFCLPTAAELSDSLSDPVNLAGSGPVPIVPREDDPHDAAPTAHPHHGDGWSPWGTRKLADRER